MTNKKRIEQIESFNGIAVIDENLLSKDTFKISVKELGTCLDRFFNYDFGDLEPEQIANNNKQLLIGKKDFFGSYETSKGRLYITLFENKYRFLFEEKEC